MLLTVKISGDEFGHKMFNPICSELQPIDQLKTSRNERYFVKMQGSMIFYSKFKRNLHVTLKLFVELLHDDVSIYWMA